MPSTGCEAGAPESGSPSANVSQRDLAREHDPPGHALHPGPAVLQPAAHAVHGDGDLYRPSRRPSTSRVSPAPSRVARRRAASRTCRSRRTTTSSGTRNSGVPEWWNVEVVATTDPATFATLTSTAAITAAVNAVEGHRGADQRLAVLPGPSRHGPGRPGGQPDRHGSPRSTGRDRSRPRPDGQPDRAGHRDRQPAERLRRHGPELPEHRHQP